MHSESPNDRQKRLKFMCASKDPEAMRVRLFVNGFNTEKLIRSEMIELFAPFGKVYDVSIHKGYLFIQYDNMGSSEAAIKKLDGMTFKDGKMMVKLAHKSKKAERAEENGELCKFFLQGNCLRGKNCFYRHDKSSMRPRERPLSPPPRRPPPDHHRGGGDRREPGRRPPPPEERRPFEGDFRSKGPQPLPRPPPPRDYDMMAPERTIKRPYPDEVDARPRPDPYLHVRPPSATVRRDTNPADLRPPFDCVIITGSSMQKQYCELIDKKLTDFGMLTTIQIVDGEHLLKKAVEEAAKYTVPYTICVTANNEEHRSLTLNILHGVAQEHRNMPLDDAMPFLSRNFDQFVEMMKKKISAATEWTPPDSNVKYLLNLLADGRRLTVEELEKVEAYIASSLKKLRPEAPVLHNRESNSYSSKNHEEDSHNRSLDRSGKGDRELLPPPSKRGDLPPPSKYHRGDHFADDSPKTGTMKDMLDHRDRERSERGLFDSRRGYNGPAVESGSASGINFNNPTVQQALDDLLNARSKEGNSHAFRF